jgi:predicted DNA-binding transcriptional regulator YafY
VPRNDQPIRQWSLLCRLEGARQGVTLAELAESVADDFPKHLRTIRRDLAALESAGYPLVTEQVDGQTRWKLVDGFRRIPALGFAPTELMALVLGGELLKPLEGTDIHAALGSALAKVSAALPSSAVAFVKQMRQFLSVSLGPHKSYRDRPQTVDALNQALAERRTVQMRYFTASRGRTSRREVDPYHLWYAGGALYLIAFDHRRRKVLKFAVERIRSLTLTDHPYQLPLGFDLDAYLRDALVVMGGTPIAVELALDKATAAWARDRVWHRSQRLTPLRAGRLRMTLQVADTRELVGWILSFGSGVRVVSPPALRARVMEEARKVAAGAPAQAIVVTPRLRKPSSKVRQAVPSRRVVTTTKAIASQNERR